MQSTAFIFVFLPNPPSGIEGTATGHIAGTTSTGYSTLTENKIDETMADKTEMTNWINFLDALDLTENDDSEFILAELPSTVFDVESRLWGRIHAEGYKTSAKKPSSSFKVISGALIKTE